MSVEAKFLTRAAELTGAYGTFGTNPFNVDNETAALPRCELIKQSLTLFIRFVYAKDSNGFFRNLSGNTAIPRGVWVPFAHAGKPRAATGTRSQLTRDEREIVRRWLAMLKANRRYPLFIYNGASRRWCVDTVRYSDENDGLQWLARNALDAKAFVALRAG